MMNCHEWWIHNFSPIGSWKDETEYKSILQSCNTVCKLNFEYLTCFYRNVQLPVKVLEIIIAFVFKIFHLGMKPFISNGSYSRKDMYTKAWLKFTERYLIEETLLSYKLKYVLKEFMG